MKINKILASSFSTMFLLMFLLLPSSYVGAIGCQTPGGTNGTNPPSGGSKDTLCINAGIENPLSTELDTIPKLVEAILKIVLTIGVPIVTLAIIYTGFQFVQAQGNSEAINKAKKTLTYTLIGAALLLGSWVLANAIQGTVNEIKNDNSTITYISSKLYI